MEEGGVRAAEEGGAHAAEEEQVEEAEETPAGSADVETRDESRDAEPERWFRERDALPDPTIRPPRGEASASAAAAELPASGDVDVARGSATPEAMAVESGAHAAEQSGVHAAEPSGVPAAEREEPALSPRQLAPTTATRVRREAAQIGMKATPSTRVFYHECYLILVDCVSSVLEQKEDD